MNSTINIIKVQYVPSLVSRSPGCYVKQSHVRLTRVTRGTSRSHYVLISSLSQQQVEVKVVTLLKANKAAKQPTAG